MQPAQPARPAAPAQPASAPRLTPAPAAPQAAAPPPTAAPAAPPLPPMPVEFSAPSSHDDIEIDFSVHAAAPASDGSGDHRRLDPPRSSLTSRSSRRRPRLPRGRPSALGPGAHRYRPTSLFASSSRRTLPRQRSGLHLLPPRPYPLEAAPHGSDPDADIRHLTESTIRMSGLDDFEWSVSEPSLKPPSQLLETGEASFPARAHA